MANKFREFIFLRQLKGFKTQQALADAAGLTSRHRVTMIEARRTHMPTKTTLHKLAKTLNVSVNGLKSLFLIDGFMPDLMIDIYGEYDPDEELTTGAYAGTIGV